MSWLLWIVLQRISGYVHLFNSWFSLDICLGVELLGHMVALFLVFKETSILFSIVAVSICIFWSLIPCQLLVYKYFTSSWQLSFVLLMISFAMQKLLSLIRSNLFVFVFTAITLESVSKEILLQFISKSACFSLRILVSSLTVRTLIHFEFVFVYSVRECPYFILVHVTVQFPQHHLLKRLFLTNYKMLVLCEKCHW